MFRVKIKNKDTGDIFLGWECFDFQKKTYCVYSDIETKNMLDPNEYEVIEESSDGIPFNMFGIECGKGWIPLIKPIIEYIDKFNEGKSEEDCIHITQIKEKWACYDEVTEVLTKDGWKLFKDVSKKDSVMTLNPSSGHMVYQTPIDLISYHYNYDMYSINGNCIDLLVTPNHNLYVSSENGKKFELSRTDKLFGKKKTFMIGGGTWVGKSAKKSETNISIEDIAVNINGKYKEGLPSSVKNISKKKIQQLLDVLYSNGSEFTTTSKQICDDVCELIVKCGFSFNVNTTTENGTVYSILLNKEKFLTTDDSYIEGYEKYNGMVYCLTVPNHILYVRRNGKGCWCGNCLRVYVSKGTRELFDMIEKAEDESSKVCEECGSRENIGTTMGYYRTLCHDCVKDITNKSGMMQMWHNHTDDNVYYIIPNEEDKLISSFDEFKKEMP